MSNIYISDKIQKEWPSHEFRGKRRISKWGFEYMEAKHLTLEQTQFYVFGANSFVDKEGIQCGCPELIFSD